MRPVASHRRGFALLAALALLALVSVTALELNRAARPGLLATAGIAERLQGEEAATAGVEQARALLLRLEEREPIGLPTRRGVDPTDPWAGAHGATIGPQPIGDWVYRVEMRDANAALHLNAATEQQLRLFFLALRVDARRASRLAAAIADWRDPDQLRRLDGAEQGDYLRAGSALLPEDDAFSGVATLRFVMGMSDSLFAVARPYLTTAGSQRVNLNSAGRAVLLTLPGMTQEAATVLLRRRAARPVRELYRFGDELSPGARQSWREALPLLATMTTVETREMLVTSEAWQPAGVTRVRVDAIVSRDAEGRVIWRRVLP